MNEENGKATSEAKGLNDGVLEKELRELGSEVGKFLDRQGQRISRNLDRMKGQAMEALTKLAEEIDEELDRVAAKRSEEEKEQERRDREKLAKLRFGLPIRAHGRPGFYVGLRDSNSPIFSSDHEVALQAPGKSYTTFVRLSQIEIRD